MSKEKIISIRLTEEEYNTIKKSASELGMKVSRYLREKGVGKSGYTLSERQRIYQSICKIKDGIMYGQTPAAMKECDNLWLILR